MARLRRPDWREWLPALDECERLPDREARMRAMYLRYRLIAAELRAIGIDVDYALGDRPEGRHEVVGRLDDDETARARVDAQVGEKLQS